MSSGVGSFAEFTVGGAHVVRRRCWDATDRAVGLFWVGAHILTVSHFTATLARLDGTAVGSTAHHFAVELDIVRYPCAIECQQSGAGPSHEPGVNQVGSVGGSVFYKLVLRNIFR